MSVYGASGLVCFNIIFYLFFQYPQMGFVITWFLHYFSAKHANVEETFSISDTVNEESNKRVTDSCGIRYQQVVLNASDF